MSSTSTPGHETAAATARSDSAPIIAFVLFKYFPYGGLQRDFLRIASAVQAGGARVRVYTLEWRGALPSEFDLRRIGSTRWWNYRRYAQFVAQVQADLRLDPVRLVVGFNRQPGLDVHFAADPCFRARADSRGAWYRGLPRTRWFLRAEDAVLSRDATTRVLVLSAGQQAEIQRCYGTPPERFVLLPPGIARDRQAGDDAALRRRRMREAWRIAEDEHLVLLIGSGFRVKGLGRAIRALAALPTPLRAQTRLLAVGDDNPRPFQRLAARLGVADRLSISAGRDDVPDLLQGADLLLHPAERELAGMVLLEAIVAGLPVLTTAACGYAQHVLDARAGVVLREPFAQERLDDALRAMLTSAGRTVWRANGIAYGNSQDLYGMPARAAATILAQAGVAA